MEKNETAIVVVGAMGFIGRAIVLEAARTGRNVLGVVRRAKAREGLLRAYVAERGGDPNAVRLVEGDVTLPSLGLSEVDAADARRARGLVDTAALFAFGASYSEARVINVEGALETLRFASTMPRLRAMVHIGGYRIGRVAPERIARLGAYERTKHEAHALVRDEAKRRAVPLAFVHPASIVGDSRTGEGDVQPGLTDLARDLHARRLRAKVGSPRTFVPLISVDYVARFALATLEGPIDVGAPAPEHVLLDPRTPALFELVDRIAAHYAVPSPRLTLPLSLVRHLPKALTGVEPEALEFLAEDRYDVKSAEALAARHGLELPAFESTLARHLDHLASVGFTSAV